MSRTLLDCVRERIVRVQRQYGMSCEEATDVVCESLTACLCCLRAHHPDKPADGLLSHLMPGFLDTVIRKRVADHYRRQRLEQRAIAECTRALVARTPEQQALTLLLADEIWDALPENCRQVVYLRIYEQCSWDEMAQVTGLGVSTTKMRFQRGIEQARKKLGVTCDESSPSNDFFIGSTLAGETALSPDGGENSNATTDLPLEHRPHTGAGEPNNVAYHRKQRRTRRGREDRYKR
jgi:RNA polymerase sigma factor (sigma-70 family)